MASEIVIKNPRVYDKKNGVNGEKKDLLLSEGIIVDVLKKKNEAQIIDGEGKIAFPGAIDLKSHCFAQETNFARVKALSEKTIKQIPSFADIQKYYLNSGFTFIIEADVPISQSKVALRNLKRDSILDHALIFDLASNWLLLHDFQDKKETKYISAMLSFILDQQKGYGISINHPYHPQFWNFIKHIPDDPEDIPIFRLKVKEVFLEFIKAINFNNLRAAPFIIPYGMEDSINEENQFQFLNYIFEQDTVKHASDRNIYLHLSNSNHYFLENIGKFIDFYNNEKKLAIDVTPILFGGKYPLITRDRNLAMRESRKSGIPVSSVDLELDTEYYVTTRDLTVVNKENIPILTSWIEIILNIVNKGISNRISLASNTPYNISILDWPSIYAILINSKFRQDYLAKLPAKLLDDSNIQNNTYELHLIDIEELICYNPAKSLGISDKKGNLGLNSDADVILFDINPETIHNKEKRDIDNLIEGFSNASTIIKNGTVIKKNGIFESEFQKLRTGKILWNKGTTDPEILSSIIKSKESFYDKYSSIYLDSLKNNKSNNLREIS